MRDDPVERESAVGRAFVAVVPPVEVLDAIEPVAARLAGTIAGARVVRREQWHLTLQFLGNHADLDLCATLIEASLPTMLFPHDVQLGGLGAFPNARRTRVLWLGAQEGGAWLGEAAAAVARALAPTGFVPPRDDAHPHLTLARPRSPIDLRRALAEGAALVGPRWRASEVVLVHSMLGAAGPTHRVHARVQLREDA